MDTAKQAAGVIEEAERQLRELVGAAAAAGRYDEVKQIADWARTLGALTNGARHPGVVEFHVATDSSEGATDRPGATGGSLVDSPRVEAPPASTPAARRRKRAPAKGEYPKFFRRGDQLVKIGWSKKEREEYVHKAPRCVIDALAAAVAKRAARAKVFTAEQLFPLADPQDGGPIPGYQGYVALAWFKSAGLVKQHGRSGYSLRNGSPLADAVVASWQKLPEQ